MRYINEKSKVNGIYENNQVNGGPRTVQSGRLTMRSFLVRSLIKLLDFTTVKGAKTREHSECLQFLTQYTPVCTMQHYA